VDLGFQSNPTGLQLTVGGSAATTPFTHTVIAGSRNTIAAPLTQARNGTGYEFVSWSDGGAAQHDMTAPATAATYTATYRQAPTGCNSGQWKASYFANQTLSGRRRVSAARRRSTTTGARVARPGSGSAPTTSRSAG
jgi:hypothetical protein